MSGKLEIHDLKVSWAPRWVTIADEDVISEYDGEVLLRKGNTVHFRGIIGRHEVEAKHMTKELRDALEAFAKAVERQHN